MSPPKRISLVVRTLNEARYMPALLEGVRAQHCPGFEVEVVVIDSGSTDGTQDIARRFGCVLAHIRREEFSFGRSLNRGCEAASGDILVFVSGHCVPVDALWLQRLCEPIASGLVQYSYGRQIGGPESRYSECRIFEKYYPRASKLPQSGYFSNNANAALARESWARLRFDEELTGLEDMELAKRLCASGGRVGYVAEACVYHYHSESWAQVKRRFEREALALQKIMPQIHVRRRDTLRYIASSIAHDLRHARAERRALALAPEIVRYRVAQYVGSYQGNHQHRLLSHAEKDHYFYPTNRDTPDDYRQAPGRGAAADEGQQRARPRQELP